MQPSYFAATATMIHEYVKYHKDLTTIDLQNSAHHLWKGPEHFKQRNIQMTIGVGSDNINPQMIRMKKTVVEALILQLVACGIFEYVVECDKRMWKWGRVAGEVENFL